MSAAGDNLEPLSTAHIGRAGQPTRFAIELGHVRRFCEAIGENDSIYREIDAAKRAGHTRIPAPPTFATALRPDDPRKNIAIDWKKLLHAEQSFTYHRQLYVGDELEITQRIANVFEKSGKSGVMDFLVLETAGTLSDGTLAFTANATVVVKR